MDAFVTGVIDIVIPHIDGMDVAAFSVAARVTKRLTEFAKSVGNLSDVRTAKDQERHHAQCVVETV